MYLKFCHKNLSQKIIGFSFKACRRFPYSKVDVSEMTLKMYFLP